MKITRIEKILASMEENKIPQMIVTSKAAIFYLTGKWIEAGNRMIAFYINTRGDKKFIVNEMFPVTEEQGLDIIKYTDIDDPIEILIKCLNPNEILGVDRAWPSHFLIKLMEKNAAKAFVNGSPLIDRARMIKDLEEQELMRNASRINDKVMSEIVNHINADNTEKRVCSILGDLYEKEGAQGFSFSPIVAYGVNGSDPHNSSGNSLPKAGDSVTVDTGCVKDYYSSDMTRTFFYKEVSEAHRKIHDIVLEANIKGIEAVKPGIRFCDVDKAARGVIESYGYGEYFTHRTGHSIGIETHDFGDVSSINEDILKPGMIFSVEPGVYLPGDMGVRIEDLVLVTETGCEILNSYPKELTIIK